MKKYCLLFIFPLLILGCKTVDFEKQGTDSEEYVSPTASSLEEEQKEAEDFYKELAIEEELKVIDIDKTVVYVEQPVYYPVEKPDKKLTGKDAVKAATQAALQIPENYKYGTIYYDFNDDFTYEVYCQAWRTTDLQLEPGEQVIEMPFCSEPTVWEIGAGVSRYAGQDVQHFFIKPAYSGLESSFIIITDRRVYHLILKSFKDCYMTQVKWKYPNLMPFNLTKDSPVNGNVNSMTKEFTTVDPRFLSFDYKMKYSSYKKPYWLPYRVYDDGQKTYITMNETVLHMESPVLFNKRNQRINYFVNGNIIVINELIEKVTLRIGNEKVIITKKKYKEDKKDIEVTEEAEKQAAEKEKKYNGLHQPMTKASDPSKVPAQQLDSNSISTN